MTGEVDKQAIVGSQRIGAGVQRVEGSAQRAARRRLVEQRGDRVAVLRVQQLAEAPRVVHGAGERGDVASIVVDADHEGLAPAKLVHLVPLHTFDLLGRPHPVSRHPVRG